MHSKTGAAIAVVVVWCGVISGLACAVTAAATSLYSWAISATSGGALFYWSHVSASSGQPPSCAEVKALKSVGLLCRYTVDGKHISHSLGVLSNPQHRAKRAPRACVTSSRSSAFSPFCRYSHHRSQHRHQFLSRGGLAGMTWTERSLDDRRCFIPIGSVNPLYWCTAESQLTSGSAFLSRPSRCHQQLGAMVGSWSRRHRFCPTTRKFSSIAGLCCNVGVGQRRR